MSTVYGSIGDPGTIYGLSTDTKPTLGLLTGTAFVEMDTSKVYFFDSGASEWLEWGASS